MLFKSLATASLVASAIAAPLQHQHHQHQERDVAVVTKTNVVVVTVGNGDGALTLASSPTSTPAAGNTEAPQNQPSSFSNPSQFSSVVAPSAATSTASSAPSSSGSSTPQPSSSGSFNGGAKGVTYTPYSPSGGCKSSSQIASELQELSGFEVIRIYGVDCNQVAAVLAGKQANQKIFAGIFDVTSIQSDVNTLAAAVNAASGGWDNIHTVSIGNELVNSGEATPSQVAQYVQTGKSALQAAGWTGPVVAVDTFIAVLNNPSLCEYSDYLAINAHPFFDGYVEAANAGDWVLEQIQNVYNKCGGSKNVLVTESGWPYQGDANNECVPSVSNQQAAVASIKSKAGSATLLFSGFDEPWKASGEFNVEKYWGFLPNQPY